MEKSILDELPDWYDESNYDFHEKLTPKGWATLLKQMEYLDWYYKKNPEDAYRSWERQASSRKDWDEFPDYFIAPFGRRMPVEFIDVREDDFNLLKWMAENTIPCRKSNSILLRVDFDLPDDLLIPAVLDAIQQHRRIVPSPGAKIGRQSETQRRFRDTVFKKWGRCKVVGLFDLEFWSRHHNRRLTHAETAEALFPDLFYDDDQVGYLSKKISQMKGVYREARNSLTPLTAQLLAENSTDFPFPSPGN